MWAQTTAYAALVAAGAAVGGALRFLVMNIPALSSGTGAGTLTVNLAGCILIGILTAVCTHFGAPRCIQLALVTGVLGGFTTFSTFALDAAGMIDRGLYMQFAKYTVLSVAGGIVLCMLSLYGTSKLLQTLFPK